MPAPARLLIGSLMLGLGLIVAIEATSQPNPPGIPDEVVRKMLQLALQNIDRAMCESLNPCAPATPAEFENPPIMLDHARAAVLAGTRTALARWCGLDADRRNLLPMTRHLRKVLRFNERQIALMALIHSIQQGVVAEQLKTRGECDEATRSKLDAQLPKG